MFSNSNQPIVIEEGDRRYFVSKSKKNINSVLTEKELDDFWGLKNSEFFKNQVDGFCAFLNNSVDMNYNKVTSTPPMTKEKENIISINKTDFKHVIEEIMENSPIDIEFDTRKTAWIGYENLYLLYHNEDNSRYRKKEVTKKKFSAKLSMEGFEIKKNTINSKTRCRVRIPQHIIVEQKAKELFSDYDAQEN